MRSWYFEEFGSKSFRNDSSIETRLIRDARDRGLQTISGIEMFINQAVLQFEEFTGAAAPAEVMGRVVREHLAR
jgi:shikimate dehydrogenase